jgi:hypothetical protein
MLNKSIYCPVTSLQVVLAREAIKETKLSKRFEMRKKRDIVAMYGGDLQYPNSERTKKARNMLIDGKLRFRS